MTDYLILGGGLAGSVLATRLKEKDPSSTVTLVEGGSDEHKNADITEPMGTFKLHGSDFQYNYNTVPQTHYNGRKVFMAGGKVLSGSTSVNYAMWTRGGKSDYDLWSSIVGDTKWSYEGMLPYFRKTETHHAPQEVDMSQHGSDGPIHTTASARHYPLRDDMKNAFLANGLQWKADANAGDPIGAAPYTENWRNAKRQPAGYAYGLKGVDVVLNKVVRRVLLENGTAIGAEFADGSKLLARKEVILSCGAVRSPQILMLSGIGRLQELQKHGIAQIIDSPYVGSNLHDHVSIALLYRVREPEKSLVMMSPGWTDPSYFEGMPVDLVATANAPANVLKPAMIKDGISAHDDHPHLAPSRGHIEIIPVYGPMAAPQTDVTIPFDGTCLTVGVLNLLPTSRGSIQLASIDPAADPLIDPNYYATETDRTVLREGLRMALRIVECPEGQKIFGEEIPPNGLTALSSTSSDADLDAHVRALGATWHHPAGTCAMGKVVDTDLKVIGVNRLRVVDASVLPGPIGGHYQVPTYALAEQAADIIASAN